jgi:putative membrane protein
VRRLPIDVTAAALVACIGAAGALAQPMGAASHLTGRGVSTPTFVHEVARGDVYEIRAAELARSRAASSAVVQFAAQMIKTHERSQADLSDVLAQAGVNDLAPDELDVRRKGLLGDLRASGGDEFDRRYIGQQIAAHQAALNLAEDYASSGGNPVLRRAASEMIPSIAQDLGRAKALPSP